MKAKKSLFQGGKQGFFGSDRNKLKTNQKQTTKTTKEHLRVPKGLLT